MRYYIAILLFIAALVPVAANAKRAQAAKVEPVIYEGVRYTAPNNDGGRGYIQAWDTKTNKMLWEATVFRNFINPLLEEDVQWVFIKKLSFEDGKLIVVDERDRAYTVDTKTHRVRKVKSVSTHKTQANNPDAANPAMALQLHIGSQWRRVADLER